MINKNEEITISQCRQLRESIVALTNGCMLTQGEFAGIMLILNEACNRLESEGRVRHD